MLLTLCQLCLSQPRQTLYVFHKFSEMDRQLMQLKAFFLNKFVQSEKAFMQIIYCASELEAYALSWK